MNTTVALPLHVTLETVVLAAAGLLLAWSVLRRRYIPAAGALALGIAEGLHAGQFIGNDDAPVLIALRLLGVVGVGSGFIRREGSDRTVDPIVGAVVALAVGVIWSGAAGGSAEDMTLGAHLFMFAGAAALLFWVWQATRPSVRLRVLAAFVAVLAVTVVVAGGAVARVAALKSISDEERLLQAPATVLHNGIVKSAGDLLKNAAVLSPSVASDFESDSGTADALRKRVGPALAAAEVAPDGRVGVLVLPGFMSPEQVFGEGGAPRTAATRSALAGKPRTGFEVSERGLAIIAAAPVYKRGGKAVPADVIGAIVLADILSHEELEELGAITDPDVDVALIDRDTVFGDSNVAGIRGAEGSRAVRFRPIETSFGRQRAAVVQVSNVTVVVLGKPGAVARSATDLVRAFLVAILAAALVAVVAALWLSARISRPMLDLADEAERVKTDFLSSVSHELRTPLTPIRGYAEILRRGRIPARDQGEYLDEIGVAAQRLERIVALLLDVAAIEAGRFRVDASDLDVGELLEEVKENWKSRSRKHTIEVRAPRSLPQVHADAEAITRVLDELVDNAYKFVPEGEVELRAKKTGDRIEFAVTDNGPGIDPERITALREAFSQADSGDTRRYGGLGLGLAFAEGVLAAHGSRLEIKSVAGEGTTCSFLLPAAGSVTRMSARAATRTR
jgi:signal transduction histidine kinase